MKTLMIAALAASTALTGVLPAAPALAQPGWHDRDGDRRDRGRHEGWRNHDRDRRSDRDWDRRGDARAWRYCGGRYGYDGYGGRWRTGQRYSHWRDHRYVITDYRAYHLPPPRPGYRYYRDDSGDVVMVAVASGIIGLIAGAALADR